MPSVKERAQQRAFCSALDVLIRQTLLFARADSSQIGKHTQRATNDFQMQHGLYHPALHRLERRAWVTSKWETGADCNREG